MLKRGTERELDEAQRREKRTLKIRKELAWNTESKMHISSGPSEMQ